MNILINCGKIRKKNGYFLMMIIMKGGKPVIFCGNDITSVKRIEEAIKKGGETFLKKVYTDEEIKYCESRRMRKI